MKKTALILMFILTAVLCSCKSGDTAATTESDTVKYSETVSGAPESADVTAAYGDEWQFASLGKQILAEDENWSLTGSGFEYKNGYMGISGDGFFDLANLNRIGDEENYILEFEYLALPGARLGVYFNLLGADSLLHEGEPGILLVFSEDSVCAGFGPGSALGKKEGFRKISVKVDQTDRSLQIGSDGAVCAKLTYEEAEGVTVTRLYDGDGGFICEQRRNAPLYAGGMIKLRAANCSVYLRNVAFRIY